MVAIVERSDTLVKLQKAERAKWLISKPLPGNTDKKLLNDVSFPDL